MITKSKAFFKTPSRRYLNYPILGLIVSTSLLLIIVGLLTWTNYNRESQLMEDSLKRQGETVINAMKAGFRSGMDRMWGQIQLNILFRETATGPNIDRILLVNGKGAVINDSKISGTNWGADFFFKPDNNSTTSTLIYQNSDNENIFRLISPFKNAGTRMYQYGEGQFYNKDQNCNSDKPILNGNGDYYIVLDLKMFEYQEAQAEDIRFAILYGLILLIVGSASFYFLLLAQNYYVTNHTLRTMESYTQNIVESMPNGLISLDNKGQIESINRNAINLLKLESSNVKGRKLSSILQNCNIPENTQLETSVNRQQVECQLNDGTTIPLNITLSKLNNGTGESIGLVIILHDLRNIRSLEEQIARSERLASLGRMAAGIAHEIRNPLSSIKGFVQYFKNKFPDNSEDRIYASVVVNEVDRLNRVIQDLLNFAKPKEPILKKVFLHNIISHSLTLVQPDITGKHIQLNRNYLAEDSPPIMGDSDMLTQVFINLFLNAISAMPTGGNLEISVNPTNENIVILITDTGTGIQEINLSKVFDPFFTTKKDGTGLGLAIVYRIVESHRGELSVESIPGDGTTFRIIFPTFLQNN